ncbi:TMEM165/GDT1 family protein [Sphingomonas sp.]|uniref:TMEM165/GDT1 family protein n=1 Tax=Sphingomonas sp. TaxID=28214 RepID=UPI003B000DB3
MEALIPALVAAGLAEMAGRMQHLAVLLARRFGRVGPVLAGLLLAAIANMGMGAALGVALGREVPHSAARLLVGVALLLAGGGALFRPTPAPAVDRWRLGSLLSSFGAALILGFGESAVFVAVALSAASGAPVETGIGAAIGILLACAPAALFADRWTALPALRSARVGAGVLLMLAGAAVALSALEIA